MCMDHQMLKKGFKVTNGPCCAWRATEGCIVKDGSQFVQELPHLKALPSEVPISLA